MSFKFRFPFPIQLLFIGMLITALFPGFVHALDEDIGVIAITEPSTGMTTDTDMVTVRVQNFGADPINRNAFVIRYQINSGSIVRRNASGAPIAAGGTFDFTFPVPEDFTLLDSYTIVAQTFLNADFDSTNNQSSVTISPDIITPSATEVSNFPYTEDFEGASASDWMSFGRGTTDFVLGTPGGTRDWVVDAASGTNAWATGLTGFYNPSGHTQVQSPIFDLRAIPYAEISLNVVWETGGRTAGARLDFSTDDTTWSEVGAAGDPENWYNQGTVTGFVEGGTAGWSGYKTAGTADATTEAYESTGTPTAYFTTGDSNLGSAGYVTAKNYVQGGEKTRFRVFFSTIGGSSDEGFAFDDFSVKSVAQLAKTIQLQNDVNGDGTVDVGDTLLHTVVIDNFATAKDFTSTSYSDMISDANLSLVPGTVTTSAGTVSSGNGGSDTSVQVGIATISSSSSVTISYQTTVDSLGASTEEVCSQGTFVSTEFNASTDNLSTTDPADTTCIDAFGTEGTLVYSADTFEEAAANDGSIATMITVTLSDDTFTKSSGDFTAGVEYTVMNVPAGLTLKVTATSSTSATIKLLGNATAHENAQDISNLVLAFQDAAFTTQSANVVENSQVSFSVDFADMPASTPTPTATPTPTPTATPVPTPTPVSKKVVGVITVDGQPRGGAIVYVVGLGTVLTDENGRFEVDGAEDDTEYQIFVQAGGVTFSSSTGTGGSSVRIDGAAFNFNPQQCALRDVSKRLSRAGTLANKLFSRAQRTNSRLNRSIPREENMLSVYVQRSLGIPGVILNCEASAGCETQSLKRKKRRAVRQLSNLRRSGLFANRLARKRGVRGPGRANRFARGIRRLHIRGRRILRRLPKNQDICSS